MVTVDEILDYINDNTEVSAKKYYQGWDNKWFVEAVYSSDLGEGVVETIWLDEYTGEAMLKAINNTLEWYDEKCEEILVLYLQNRPRGTENFKVRDLVDDKDWKVQFWKNFVEDVLTHFSE